ncbi:MAG: sigma-70 family RNA polymerase sigma factor [Deltaproteobacteria bacterium]|nr:sigma-70 family RNA polymerase sigma factor [Deltaproteobacteria bacterium]
MDSKDGELIADVRRGNTEAVTRLADRYLSVCYSIALSFLHLTEDAEDAAQQAMMNAISSIHQLRDNEKFRPWLYQIVRNTSRGYLRKRKDVQCDYDFSNTPSEDRNHEKRTSDKQVLLSGLKTLSESERQVMLLHDMEGMNHKEVGEMLGISEEYSRQHLFVARKKMKRILSENGGKNG